MAILARARLSATPRAPFERVSAPAGSPPGPDVVMTPSLPDALALAIRLAVERQARLRAEARRTIKGVT